MNLRILCVDDDVEILDEYRRILANEKDPLDAFLEEETDSSSAIPSYQFSLAKSGEEAVDIVQKAFASGDRFAAGFFDMRMPGGIDGYETIKKIKEIDSQVFCAVVTAFYDRELEQIRQLFIDEHQDELLYFKKPFSALEVRQAALNMISAWNRKRKEEKQVSRIKQAYEQLKAEIEERKRVQESLVQAQKMEIVGRLAGGVAHDFNNILTTILGYSQIMVIKLDEGNPMRDMVEDIHDAAERAAGLTRQLLAFSRKQVMEMRVVNLNTVVENISKMLGRLIGEDIEMQMKLAESIKNVKADLGQIEQVIMNLVINARDAMPGGGRLTIETGQVELDEQYSAAHHEVEPGMYTVLTVTDTGKGMSQEVQDKIFEPFFTTKKREKGTGLGLAMVYGIVRQHNGHIYVYSEPEKGTTFKIYLPVDLSSAEELGGRDTGKMPLGNETVLVVDDDDAIRRLVKDTLEPLGYNLLEAGSGEDALAVMKRSEEKVDMVLTDLIMPGMNGHELLDIIRQVQPDIKSILMSGYTDDIVVHCGDISSGVNFINKPLLPVFLSNKVREVLDTEHG